MLIDRRALRPLSRIAQGEKAATPELVGKWENELGSVVTIDQFDGTNFSGTYETAVGNDGLAATAPLFGTVAGDAIAFTVNWGPTYVSVRGWSGLLLADGNQACMYTLWNLSCTPMDEDDFQHSILTGADLFARA
ncbi:avidin/streptavidin family protein [Paraburkholderia sp. EG286A]